MIAAAWLTEQGLRDTYAYHRASGTSAYETDWPLAILKKGGFLAHRNRQGVEMRQKSGKLIDSAEKVIKDIRRETRKRYSSEEKIRVVLEGLAVSPPELRLPLPI